MSHFENLFSYIPAATKCVYHKNKIMQLYNDVLCMHKHYQIVIILSHDKISATAKLDMASYLMALSWLWKAVCRGASQECNHDYYS